MTDARHDTDEDAADDGAQGQVSEVGRMDPANADEPIYPEQATAGYPDTESGSPDEGTAGPNARPRDDHPGLDPDEVAETDGAE